MEFVIDLQSITIWWKFFYIFLKILSEFAVSERRQSNSKNKWIQNNSEETLNSL